MSVAFTEVLQFGTIKLQVSRNTDNTNSSMTSADVYLIA